MKILIFLSLSFLISPPLQAQTVLTESDSNIVLHVESDSTLSNNDLRSRAHAIVDFVENKLYPKVPAALLAKVKAKTLRIEITSDLKIKGGLFDPEQSQKDELVLQIRKNLFADDSVFRLIAHEWFHALQFVIHPDEPSWVREGLAQVFETIAMGGFNGPNLLAALDDSTTSLEYDFNPKRTEREAYGHTFIYFYFLYKNCGGSPLFWKIAESAPNRFDADTINAALKENPKKGCADFETTVLNAELARFHNHKVYGKDTQTDLYWLTPEFERTPKIIKEGILDRSVIDALPVHRPLLLKKSYHSALKPFLKNPKLEIYTLSKTYPYRVIRGLSSDSGDNDEILFVLKHR